MVAAAAAAAVVVVAAAAAVVVGTISHRPRSQHCIGILCLVLFLHIHHQPLSMQHLLSSIVLSGTWYHCSEEVHHPQQVLRAEIKEVVNSPLPSPSPTKS